MDESELIDVELSRIVIRDGSDSQVVHLVDHSSGRGFPIVIGNAEAGEIYRVVHSEGTPRPMTHQLCSDLVQSLGARVQHVHIVDLRSNTFFAQIALSRPDSDEIALVDARPSDAIALALRHRAPLRVARAVLDEIAPLAGGGESAPPGAPPESS